MMQPAPPPDRPPAANPPPSPASVAAPQPTARPPLMQRLHPWVDLIAKVLTALAAGLAIWKGMG